MNDFDNRFLQDRGLELFNGNELLVKGALETEGGVHLLTGYPGSPVATFFDVLSDIAPLLRKQGIEGRISNNEAIAVAAVNGTQMSPLRAMAVVKSVGLHVASDGLALGNLAGAHPDGGAVIVVGDDPWSESTQVPADSRYLCKHLHMPVVEPSTLQEVKDFVDLSFKLSRASGFYIGYLITTTLADGGGSVECHPNHYPLTNTNHPFELPTAELKTENTVLLPPRTGRKELELPERRRRLIEAARRLGLNRLEHDVPSPVAIVTAGLAYQYVVGTLAEWGLLEAIPVLKLGLTYPLDRDQIEAMAESFQHLLVIEERRGFIEEQVSQIVVQYGQQKPGRKLASVWGKEFPQGASGFPAALGLNNSIVADRLARFLRLVGWALPKEASSLIDRDLHDIHRTAAADVSIPVRTPTFCPGCPHRDSSSVLLEIKEQFMDERYMRRVHGRGPVDLLFHGDTGCYTMLMFEPNSPLMHNYSGMGLGGGTGSGIDPFITNKQVVFMGDSTFFHSGQVAIGNSIAANQDITYVILDNGTTAMTGHQPHAGLQEDLLGRPQTAQDIEQIVRAMTAGRVPVVRVNPADRLAYKRLLEKTILADGLKIVIADKECGITFNRRVMAGERAEQRHRGFVRRKVYMNITPEVCEFCLECTSRTGCPGLTVESTDYGPKMATDLSWCVNDGACAKIDACPAFEQVIVTRKRPPRPRGHEIKLEDLPEPSVCFPDGGVWRAWLAGVGGMGIGTAAGLLVRAGFAEGYRVQFADKKGLAIRNGAVFSQIIFSRNDAPHSMTIPYGKADLLLGVDMLEAVRAVDGKLPFRVASPERTATVVNTDKTPTVRMLMGLDDFRSQELEKTLRSVSRPGAFFGHPISALCERLFGTKLYANITMLGVAYQLGLIPVSLESIKTGIRQTIRADFKKNLRAFNLGRKLVTNPELFAEAKPSRSLARTVREKTTYLNMSRIGSRKALRKERTGPAARRRLPETKLARGYKHLVYTTLRACRELDRETMRDIAVRMYDLVQYGGLRYARAYAQRVRRVFLADDEKHGFAATRTVVWQLARLMLVKDEFYVAQLLTSVEKLRRDRQRYNVNPANGDRLRYRRVFHPRFFGRQIDIRVPHWSLYVLRRLRWLRPLLPWFHREDRRFLAWYEGIVDEFAYSSDAEYERQLELLASVESVNGYAEHRWPKMEAARSRAEQLRRRIRASAAAARADA